MSSAPTTHYQDLSGLPVLLTVEHLQGLTGQTPQTLRKLMNQGSLPCVRIGRRMYCPRKAFEAYIGEAVK